MILFLPLDTDGVADETGAGVGLGGMVFGTAFGTPLAVALKAPRERGSVLVVVFNLGSDENIRPEKRRYQDLQLVI